MDYIKFILLRMITITVIALIVLINKRFKNQISAIIKRNMGLADRIARFIVAAGVSILYFTNIITATWGILLLVVAAIFAVTGLIGFCPLYLPFGICTKKLIRSSYV